MAPSLLIAMNRHTLGSRWSVFIAAENHVEILSHRGIFVTARMMHLE